MTGRGFLLKFPKKPEVEGNTFDNQSEAGKSSTATSTMGRGILSARSTGRGFTILPTLPLAQTADEVKNDKPIITAGRGISGFSSVDRGKRSTIGRGIMFAIPALPPKTESDSSSILSKYEDALKERVAESSSDDRGDTTSGIIAGRGTLSGRSASFGRFTSSGRGSSLGSASASKVVAKLQNLEIVNPTPSDVSSVVKKPVLKHGTKGQPFASMSNSIQLHCDENTGVYEYEVRFHPIVDSMSFRSKYLLAHKEVLGNARTFDGTTLYLPKRLSDDITWLLSKNPVDESEIKIEIIFKRKKRLGECIHLYNVLFDRIMKILQYTRVGRKSFDPSAPKIIPQHKLEVWPGYVKAVEEQEGGLMLSLDVSHRVLCTRTVLDFMTDCYRNNSSNWKNVVKKELIGNIVLTRYNNKTYRIDDIIFDQNPQSTFLYGDKVISYVEYYKNQYNIEITDLRQPLLINRKEVRIAGEREKREYVFCLIPEICNITGLTDEIRRNFSVMKDLAAHTKMSPYQRVCSFKSFIENVNKTALAREVLAQWGLSLDPEPLKMTARMLDEQLIIFGQNKTCGSGQQAEFSRAATSSQLLEPIDIQNWILVYTHTDKKVADVFESTLLKVSGPTGMRISAARRVELQNDRTDTYVLNIRKEISDPKIQIVVIIFPTLRDDRYAAVKRTLCADIPVPSQAIHSKTLRNEAKNRSIVQKIALQMNCKMGGTLWGIRIPLQKTMICGIDTYHEAGHKGLTVGAFVASLNPGFTKWYSKPTIQDKREEFVNGLTASLESALTAYRTYNEFYPDRIIIYRDGVGDGQLKLVQSFEIPQFKEACKKISPTYQPSITFIVVQKRINTKFFKVNSTETGTSGFSNPPPGSILDHTITRKYLYDFYLVSQHVREGTTMPSHYIILEDENNFEPDILQQLTYKLCFLYYNWPGSVRVPACCQYAHKLAYLVGLHIKRPVAEKLANKLYFL